MKKIIRIGKFAFGMWLGVIVAIPTIQAQTADNGAAAVSQLANAQEEPEVRIRFSPEVKPFDWSTWDGKMSSLSEEQKLQLVQTPSVVANGTQKNTPKNFPAKNQGINIYASPITAIMFWVGCASSLTGFGIFGYNFVAYPNLLDNYKSLGRGRSISTYTSAYNDAVNSYNMIIPGGIVGGIGVILWIGSLVIKFPNKKGLAMVPSFDGKGLGLQLVAHLD